MKRQTAEQFETEAVPQFDPAYELQAVQLSNIFRDIHFAQGRKPSYTLADLEPHEWQSLPFKKGSDHE